MQVYLHGPFAAYHDGPIEVAANTAWDAIEAVVTQLKGFLPDPVAGRKRIQAVGFDTVESLKARTSAKEIHLLPALGFGKRGGLVQTVIGVALVVAAIALPGLGTIAGASINALLFTVGGSMVIGGVMQMISPVPQLTSNTEEQVRSRYLPSNQNTVRIGTCIPILWGRFQVPGHILSINVDAKDVLL